MSTRRDGRCSLSRRFSNISRRAIFYVRATGSSPFSAIPPEHGARCKLPAIGYRHDSCYMHHTVVGEERREIRVEMATLCLHRAALLETIKTQEDDKRPRHSTRREQRRQPREAETLRPILGA